jgi:anti-sigma regulatory factor (Ser/Thr protein kinase)
MVLNASLSELSRARNEITLFVGAVLNPIDLSRTIISVDEALSNVILHGYEGRDGEIKLSIQEDDEAFTFIIDDGAPPFDPLSAAPVELDDYIESDSGGGLGIDFFRRMTQTRYERNDLGGNRLILRKEKTHEEKSSS